MDKSIFGKVIQKIWIDKDKNLTYELINGLELTVTYQEVV